MSTYFFPSTILKGMLINSEPESHQKTYFKEFDTEDVKIYSLRIPTPKIYKLKYEIGRET